MSPKTITSDTLQTSVIIKTDMRHNFFTVSLANNIPVLKRSIPQINRFYDHPEFSIICPSSDVELFSKEFQIFPNIKIIPENTLISFDKFFIRANAYYTEKTGKTYTGTRLGWYYQQVLKISFLIEQQSVTLPIVMWDADTIMLSKIEFFNKNHSVLYGSLLEFHQPYFQSLTPILGVLPAGFKAFTVQFFSCTKAEQAFLISKLNQYMSRSQNTPSAQWIADVVIKAVIDTHGDFDVSLFSEQELVGLSNILCSGQPQRPLAYLRWGFEGILGSAQIFWVTLLGFNHLTYENVDSILHQKQGWFKLLAFTLKEFYRQKLKIRTAPSLPKS
ncbi:hypothetical protein KZZ10_05640 [Alcaligenaceae bacterium LF4-65]|uniref:Uncharacterized protein n=1 Tax=Zwartia hollandica TaxID=324606 RepID=A0A953T450_9BURK|nr:hypothetical protein [Zwartia hollandica]MBZ1350121.1 hypothetical protein [Zwartia hollandica]